MSQELIPFGQADRKPRATWLAPLSVVLGSMTVLLPFVATVPILPPFGLMMLLGWRMTRGNSMHVWMPVPLGLFDDAISGQPFGTAMCLWTVCVLTMDVLDTRLVFRDFWQDWLIASGSIAFYLIAARLMSVPFYAHVDTAILLQLVISAALFPLVARLCARLDRDKRT